MAVIKLSLLNHGAFADHPSPDRVRNLGREHHVHQSISFDLIESHIALDVEITRQLVILEASSQCRQRSFIKFCRRIESLVADRALWASDWIQNQPYSWNFSKDSGLDPITRLHWKPRQPYNCQQFNHKTHRLRIEIEYFPETGDLRVLIDRVGRAYITQEGTKRRG